MVSKVNSSMPKLYLYFGQSGVDTTNVSGLDLKELVYHFCVLTVVKDLSIFNGVIPSEIKNVNAFQQKKRLILMHYLTIYFHTLAY